MDSHLIYQSICLLLSLAGLGMSPMVVGSFLSLFSQKD